MCLEDSLPLTLPVPSRKGREALQTVMSKATVVVETTVLIGSLFLVLRLAPAHIEYRPSNTGTHIPHTNLLKKMNFSCGAINFS
jgi:hypothetical protein